ncbi:uncharacterized protein LOC105689988 [Athalia rosae]|uniref:uncharacterized protein LOC105689988 n=1 Tax=Athalia rosae TaxID=37344 RepID=UPI00203414D6|nr:uncharacterized protein LOC105689988 [Athalia rosae]
MNTMEHEKVEQLQGSNEQVKRDQTVKVIQRYCRDVRMRLDKYLEEWNLYENVNVAVKYLLSRPLLLAAVIAVTAAIGIPVVCFTLFAIITIACTFTGFILIEGSILAVGTLVLCGVLLSIVTTIVMIAACLAIAYYISLRVYAIFKGL